MVMVSSVLTKQGTRATEAHLDQTVDGGNDEESCEEGRPIPPLTAGPSSSSADNNGCTIEGCTDDVDNRNHDNPKKPNMGKAIWKYAVLHVLQIVNIFLWYWANGMNGIAMQTFATQVGQGLLTTSSTLRSLSVLSTCCFVTSRQLLLGAAIGRVLLLLLNPKLSWSKIQSTHWWPMSILHGIGSLATNTGFMYGKASVIQVLKLLEPFETLILSHLLFRESTFSPGVVSSMAVVVGAAASLLNLQPTAPSTQAVAAALVSGATLSCRNVLQRKHHRLAPTGTARTPHERRCTDHSSSTSSSSSSSSSPTSSSPERVVGNNLDKLEKSVVQFTQLSFYSGLWIGATSLLLRGLLVRPDEYGYGTSYNDTAMSPSPQVFLWHPLYNVFSMITLGFCSALTHSLLNSGKRVFAICLAMLWFHEGLNPASLSGLFLVGVGGYWYLAESQASIGDRWGLKDWSDGQKVAVATTALGLSWWFQSLYR